MARAVEDLLIHTDHRNFVDTSDEEVIFTPAETAAQSVARRTPGREITPVSHIARPRGSPTRAAREATPRNNERDQTMKDRQPVGGDDGERGRQRLSVPREMATNNNNINNSLDRMRFTAPPASVPLPSAMRRRSTPKSTRKTGPYKISEPVKEGEFESPALDAIMMGLRWSGSFALEILGTTLKIIKYPLSLFIGLWIMSIFWNISYEYVSGSVHVALSPLCKVPGAGRLDLPFCKPASAPVTPDYPQLIELQSNFEKVLDSSLGGSNLALDMKQSEVAIRDLSTLVKMSQLMCREQLHRHLDEFSSSAKIASRELQKLGSRVGGAVDAILAMDEWALRSLEDIEKKGSVGTGSKILRALIPFNPAISSRRDITTTFTQSSQLMDNHIQRLILEAQAVLRTLDDLENKLDVIHEVVSREDMHIRAEHSEVLAELFTMLGGNRKKLNYFQQHRGLLSNIAVYRSRALAHVSSTLIQLQQMSSDLEDLRERVVAPALLADVIDIPLEVHISSIRKGIERLSIGKTNAKNKEQETLRMLLSKHDEAVAAISMMDAAKETLLNQKS